MIIDVCGNIASKHHLNPPQILHKYMQNYAFCFNIIYLFF